MTRWRYLPDAEIWTDGDRRVTDASVRGEPHRHPRIWGQIERDRLDRVRAEQLAADLAKTAKRARELAAQVVVLWLRSQRMPPRWHNPAPLPRAIVVRR